MCGVFLRPDSSDERTEASIPQRMISFWRLRQPHSGLDGGFILEGPGGSGMCSLQSDTTNNPRIIAKIPDAPARKTATESMPEPRKEAQPIARAFEALLAAGARPEITVAATHGLFVGGACEKLNGPAIRELYVTDSVATVQRGPQLKIVSIAALLAAAIRQVVADGSLGDLFGPTFEQGGASSAHRLRE
jgi:hypothetical protein